MNTVLNRVASATFALVSLASAASAGTYSAAADFSPANNPNGVWTFGTTAGLGTAFTAFSTSGSSGGINYWATDAGLPGASHNPTGSTISSPTAEVHPGQLILHPGPAGEYAIARFTVPTSGLYQFSATFVGEDFQHLTTTDVHLLLNGSGLFSGQVNSYHVDVVSGLFTLALTAGDTIDAAVGFGVNGNYFGDTTGVDFVVELIPAPSAAALMGLGGLAVLRRRR